MSPYLPPEIIDSIFANIQHELLHRELCNYALVCSDWLAASRRRLLRVVHIGHAAAYDSFIEQVVRQERLRPWLATTTRGVFYLEDIKKDARGHRLVLELAGQLPNLHTLVLSEVDWTGLQLRAHLAFSQYRCLQELWLCYCSFPSFGNLRRLLVVLPSLANLVLLCPIWGTPKDPLVVEGQSIPRPVLHTLYLYPSSADDANQFFHWLVHTPTISSLRRVVLDPEYLDLWDNFTSTITDVDVFLHSADGELYETAQER